MVDDVLSLMLKEDLVIDNGWLPYGKWEGHIVMFVALDWMKSASLFPLSIVNRIISWKQSIVHGNSGADETMLDQVCVQPPA